MEQDKDARAHCCEGDREGFSQALCGATEYGWICLWTGHGVAERI